MPVSEDIFVQQLAEEFRVCPACGYEYGFHTSFLDVNSAAGSIKVKVTKKVYKVILVCPECGARYDIGWRMTPVEMPVKISEADVPGAVQPIRALEAGRNPD